MLDLNGQTTLYGIMGSPVTHSLSPLFQNHFFQQRGINAAYLPFAVESSVVEQALLGLHAAGIQGMNVTVPHKEAVLSWVDADADAMLIGAVNTVKRTSSSWQACNTDWVGVDAVLKGLQAQVSTNTVLLFGAGGTSRAVCHALYKQDTKKLWICNRSTPRAEALVEHLRKVYPKIVSQVLPWRQDAVTKALQDCAVMINSSSIGLNESDVFPFMLKGEGVAIDAVYKPCGKTAFTRAAALGGFVTADGLPMLIAQGIASFSYWYQNTEHCNDEGMPDRLQTLRWVEQQLARQPLSLAGWRI